MNSKAGNSSANANGAAEAEGRVGEIVTGWTPAQHPGAPVLEGRFARLERLEIAHVEGLFQANQGHDSLWTYLPYGPFATVDAYRAWVASQLDLADPFFYAIRDRATGLLGGVAAYLRIFPEIGSIEVGHINLSPQLQRGRAATEAMMLMMAWAFAQGYRRYEWKCDALNLPSRRAAQRLGFSFEGIFRQASIVRGRNRDTAWFAVTDKDWPALQAAHAAWIAPENFDDQGRQHRRLSDLTAGVLVSSDPDL